MSYMRDASGRRLDSITVPSVDPATLRTVEIPAGLGWASSPLPNLVVRVPTVPGGPGVVSISPEQAFDGVSTARSAPTTTYYVNPSSGTTSSAGNVWAAGSGANNGLSRSTPLDKASSAVAAANATGQPVMIVCLGIFPRNNIPGNVGTGSPTVDVAFVAEGRVTWGTFDQLTGYALDGTFTNCYKVALANAARVMDITSPDRFGNYTELAPAASAAQCNRVPNTWYCDGTNLYVNRADGAAVTYTNTRVYRGGGSLKILYSNAATPPNIYMGGLNPGDGFDLEGSSGSGPIQLLPSAAMSVSRMFVATNCTFRYAGSQGGAEQCITIDSFRGLAYLNNCRFDRSATDGINAHDARGSTNVYVLSVNCSSYDIGNSPQNSCNGWTNHETCIGIDVCGDYREGHGGTIASVNSGKALFAGTTVRDDRGDTLWSSSGNTFNPTACYVKDAAQYWFDGVTISMPAGTTSAIVLSSGAAIRYRNTNFGRGAVVNRGGGTLAPY